MTSYTPSTNWRGRWLNHPELTWRQPNICYLAATVGFAITYKRCGFKLTAFSDANWGNNPHNGKSMSSYIVFAN